VNGHNGIRGGAAEPSAALLPAHSRETHSYHTTADCFELLMKKWSIWRQRHSCQRELVLSAWLFRCFI